LRPSSLGSQSSGTRPKMRASIPPRLRRAVTRRFGGFALSASGNGSRLSKASVSKEQGVRAARAGRLRWNAGASGKQKALAPLQVLGDGPADHGAEARVFFLRHLPPHRLGGDRFVAAIRRRENEGTGLVSATLQRALSSGSTTPRAFSMRSSQTVSSPQSAPARGRVQSRAVGGRLTALRRRRCCMARWCCGRRERLYQPRSGSWRRPQRLGPPISRGPVGGGWPGSANSRPSRGFWKRPVWLGRCRHPKDRKGNRLSNNLVRY